MYIKDNVIWKSRSYGSLLFDVKSGKKIKLNSMATRIFLMHFSRRETMEDIIRILSYEYNIEKSQIEKDVKEFFDSIKNSGMVTEDIKRKGVINLLEIEPPLDTCTLVITGRCNLNCKHCFVSGNRPTEELATNEIKTLIDDLATLKIFDLVITGGEPLLRNDLIEILHYCNSKNIHVTLFTNGTLINDEFIDKIKNLSIFLRVSLDGATEEMNDFVRGTGVYKKVISAIKKSVSANIPTGIATVIYKNNFSEYDKMIDLAKELGVSEFEMSPIILIGNAMTNQELALSSEQIEELRLYNLKRSFDTPIVRDSLGIDGLLDTVFDVEELNGREMCSAGRSTCAVSPKGDIYPCQLFMDFSEMCAGNIKVQSIIEIWENSLIFEKFRKLSAKNIKKCASCECLTSCAGGCRARAYAQFKSLYAPMDDGFCNVTRSIWNKFCEGV
ncbi:hypothetical protein DRN58_01775 [Thermococci archaeon]|nr:MAG: hypothetical protein DRN58_01775 [Thermococci archaeon]